MAQTVAVIGAGPAGLYAARYLANQGLSVALFNRDIKPGGLAEYGIFFDKYKMKNGLRKQFNKLLQEPKIAYFGNVTIGANGDLTLEDLRSMGFDGILVTVGAQGTKWLGLPGEELDGVFHAKDLVYFYNKLPPFAEGDYELGNNVAIIGAGNVMVDIANFAINYCKAESVTTIVRRDASAVKFTKKEMGYVANNMNLDALAEEIERIRPKMDAVDLDVQAAHDFILSTLKRAKPSESPTDFRFSFLSQPARIIGENGKVTGLEVEDTVLKRKENGSTSAGSTGNKRIIPCDTVVFAIGDIVDTDFGLPIKWNSFASNPHPRYPIDGISFEAYDAETQQSIDGTFLAGWSREASGGLVGLARKDGERGAQAMLAYFADTEVADNGITLSSVVDNLRTRNIDFVTANDCSTLSLYETEQAESCELPEFKLGSNNEMLSVIRKESMVMATD